MQQPGTVRKEDLLYLKLAVKNQLLSQEQARLCRRELEELERTGRRKKARQLLVEQGVLDSKVARDLYHMVKGYLHDKAERTAREIEIDGYEVLNKVGVGAMGIVFRARQVDLDRIVAIKILLPDLASNATYVERFMREARAAAALNHPNIVQAYKCDRAGAVYYMAMEFVQGRNLKEVLEKDGPLDEKQALYVVAEVAEALAEADKAGLVHRDIKPANIMLTNGGRVKLTDLGLARYVEKTDCGLTQEGRAIGTPFYMSPEQATDQDNVGIRSDIYGLGATLFHLVTGVPPYRAPTPQAVMALHLSAPIPDARQITPSLSKATTKMIAKMMAKRQEDRYQTPQELAADARALVSGRLGKVKALGMGVRTPRGVAVGDGVGGGTATGLQPSKKRIPRARQAAATKRRNNAALLVVSSIAAALVVIGGLTFVLARGTEAAASAPSERFEAAMGPEGSLEPKPVDPRDQPTLDRPQSIEEAALRELARARTEKDRREQMRALFDVAETYGGTASATIAAEEAAAIEQELRALERRTLEEQGWASARRLLEQGRLLQAATRLRELEAEAKDPTLVAELRADAERADRERLAIFEQGVTRARQAALAGETAKAQRLLAEVAHHATPAERQAANEALARAADADRAGAEAAHAAFLVESAPRLAAMQTEAIIAAGNELARNTPHADVRSRIEADITRLSKVKDLEGMLTGALERAADQAIALDTFSGKTVTGKVVSVDGRAVALLPSGAEDPVAVGIAELTDVCRYRVLSAAYGDDNPLLEEYFGTYLLYRGNLERARAVLERARRLATAGARPTDTIDALIARGRELVGVYPAPRRDDEPVVVVAEGTPKPGAQPEPVRPTPTPGPGGGGPPGPGVQPEGPPPGDGSGEPGGKRTITINGVEVSPEEAFIFENVEKLFAGTVVGYRGASARVGYSFISSKKLGPDWRIGRPSSLRYDPNVFALRAEGRNEIVHEAIVAAPSAIEVEFTNDISLLDKSQFNLVLTDKKGRVLIASNFGLDLARIDRGRVVGRTRGADHRKAFRAGESYSIRLEIHEDEIVALVDGEVTARLQGLKLPKQARLGFNYDRVNLQIQRVYIEGRPDIDWARERLGADKDDGKGSRESRR